VHAARRSSAVCRNRLVLRLCREFLIVCGPDILLATWLWYDGVNSIDWRSDSMYSFAASVAVALTKTINLRSASAIFFMAVSKPDIAEPGRIGAQNESAAYFT